MGRRWKFLCVVVVGWAGFIVPGVAAVPAQAHVVQLRNGRTLSVLLHQGRSVPANLRVPLLRSPAVSSCDTSTNSGVLANNCGPVVHSSNPFLIFWDPSSAIPSSSKALMERYLTDTSTSGAMASDVYGVVRQYFDAAGFAGQSQSFSSSQAIVDAHAYPTSGNCTVVSPFSKCLTDGQVQAEITRVIAADGLPAGGTSTNAPIYFLVLPQNVDECFDSADCADNVFCAYHDAFGASNTLYAVIPFALLTAGKGCQFDGNSAIQSPNGDGADRVLNSFSHEYSETVTDPLPPQGWVQPIVENEVGDLCAFTGSVDHASGLDPNAYLPVLGGSAGAGTLFDQTINGDNYYTQTEWSNGANDCRAQPATATLTPAISAPTTATANPVSFDPSGSTASAGLSSATWDFGDGTTTFASGPLTTVPHTYTAPGVYNVTLTLVDDQGEVAKVSHGITIPGPTAAFTVPTTAPIGTPVSFDGTSSSDTGVGGTVESYAWSFGDGTSGAGSTTEHTYRSPGGHVASLTVRDSDGFFSATTTKSVTVTTQPLVAAVSASPTKVLTSQAVSFTGGESSDPNAGGSISAYRWSFGDGATATGKNVTHLFSKPGAYNVRLTVADPYGLTASRSVAVTVVAVPRITRVSTSLRHHVHFLLVRVNQPGRVTAAKGSATLTQPGTAAIKLKLTRFQLKRLASHHAVNLHVTVVFTPEFGPVTTIRKTLSLKH